MKRKQQLPQKKFLRIIKYLNDNKFPFTYTNGGRYKYVTIQKTIGGHHLEFLIGLCSRLQKRKVNPMFHYGHEYSSSYFEFHLIKNKPTPSEFNIGLPF